MSFPPAGDGARWACPSCVEVIPNLWLSDLRSACSQQFSQAVACFISVCLSKPEQYDLFAEHIKDRLVVCHSLSRQVQELVGLIDTNLSSLQPVVVFCETARQRSPTLVAAYLILRGRMTYEEAVASVQSKSAIAFDTPCVYERLLHEL
jgi:hypothetical protein